MARPPAPALPMTAAQREVLEKFGADADELMADDPETEQGKGDSADGSALKN